MATNGDVGTKEEGSEGKKDDLQDIHQIPPNGNEQDIHQIPPNDNEQNIQKSTDKPPPSRACEKCREFKCNTEIELQRHLNEECQERAIPCPRNCKKNIKAKNLEKHLPNCMGLKKVDCPYKREGCDDPILLGDKDNHLKDRVSEHLQLVREDLIKRDRTNADERDEIRNDMNGIKEEINSENEKLFELRENIGKLEDRVELNEKEIKVINKTGKDIKSELEVEKAEIAVCKSYLPRVEGNETEIEKLKSQIAGLELHLANLELQVANALSKLNQNIHWMETSVQSVTTHKPQNCNVLVWSVDIAPARQNPGAIIMSQRFYTSPKGYCISAKLYIGRVEVAPKHYQEIMCIAVTVEHGDWDKMLTWPLSGFVSIELLNHLAPSDHYKPGNLMEFHQVEKPQKGKEGELASVQIPLHAIMQVPAKSCYLKNDIVHVRVMVNNNYKVPEWLL